eukprot:Hpha_TRINITY_DN16778_c5_g1::TRINITY_DN16778_c5_g1_i1::g.77588::m.77588
MSGRVGVRMDEVVIGSSEDVEQHPVVQHVEDVEVVEGVANVKDVEHDGGEREEWWPVIAEPPDDHPCHEEALKVLKAVGWGDDTLRRRKAVLNQIRSCVGARFPWLSVEAFGSTQLRTYLPEGDLDITLCR